MSKKSVPYAAYEKRGQMIELLEGDVERLQAELKQANAVVDNETINALRAENERLRAALAEIVDCINHDYSRRDIETVAHNALAAVEGER